MVLHRAPAGALIACVATLALCGCPEDRRTGDEELTPGQVIGAARAINVGEIDQATAVQGRIVEPELSMMVDRIIQDHRAALQSLEQVSTQMTIVGEESEITKELQEDAAERTDELAAKHGDDLAGGFIDAQVDAHQRALEIIDDKLMPSTTEPTLQRYLAELRGLVAAHLEMAKAHQERARETPPREQGSPSGEPAPTTPR